MSVSIIIALDVNNPVFSYVDVHLGDFGGRPAPGTTLGGHVVQNFGGMSPQHLFAVMPRDWVPPNLQSPSTILWEGELPPNLQYVGYVCARPSLAAWFFRRSVCVDNYLEASSQVSSPCVTSSMFLKSTKTDHFRRPPIPTTSAPIDHGPTHVEPDSGKSISDTHPSLPTSASIRRINVDEAEPVPSVLQTVLRNS
jgi:hypothetical protein